MGKFKNLEEIIELCSEELDENSEYYNENVHATLDFEDLKDLENLINKNKELEKMVELMVEKLSIYKFEEIICMETECEHITLEQEGKCIGDKACILDYFRKKAKGE